MHDEMKIIHIRLSETDFNTAIEKRGRRSWRDFFLDSLHDEVKITTSSNLDGDSATALNRLGALRHLLNVPTLPDVVERLFEGHQHAIKRAERIKTLEGEILALQKRCEEAESLALERMDSREMVSMGVQSILDACSFRVRDGKWTVDVTDEMRESLVKLALRQTGDM